MFTLKNSIGSRYVATLQPCMSKSSLNYQSTNHLDINNPYTYKSQIEEGRNQDFPKYVQ